MSAIPEKTIGRLSLYRRCLMDYDLQGKKQVYSHELAKMAGVSAAQVRRDIMNIGYTGNPVRGYDVEQLIASIEDEIDQPDGQRVALIGLGNLGRAIMTYFSGRRPNLKIVAAFDIDPEKIDRLFQSVPCYGMDRLDEIVRQDNIDTAIISTPSHEVQYISDRLTRMGIRGILNFAPTRINVADGIYVENIDMAIALEKVAYFARQSNLAHQ